MVLVGMALLITMVANKSYIYVSNTHKYNIELKSSHWTAVKCITFGGFPTLYSFLYKLAYL